MSKLHVGDGLGLPEAATAQHTAVLGKTGSGKTSTGKLRSIIGDAVKEAEASDPKALKRKVAELEKQLAGLKVQRTALLETVVKEVRVEVPVLKNGQLKRTEQIADRVGVLADKFAGELAELRRLIAPAAAPRPAAPSHTKPVPSQRPAAPVPKPAPPSQSGAITTRQQRFLDAAATLTTLGAEVSRETVCGWVGVHPRGGSVGEELKALEDAGLLTNDRGRLTVTEAGLAAAGQLDPREAVERAKAGLTARQRRFFDLIVAAYPGGTTREAIAEEVGIHPRGGSLGEDLGRLVGRGLVERDRGEYRARAFLFAGT